MASRNKVFILSGCALVWLAAAQAQRGADWTTAGNDAQRSSWVRSDAKISKGSMLRPGFSLAWKVKLQIDPKQTAAMAPPVLLDRYIGYRGFRSLAFLGSAPDRIYAIDTDLGRVEWQKHFAPAPSGGAPCPSTFAASMTRPTSPGFPTGGTIVRLGSGRGGPARSAVGKPDDGAVTIPATVAALSAAPTQPQAVAPGGAGAARRALRAGRAPNLVYSLSNDGMLRTLYLSNGEDADPPISWFPPGAGAHGLIVLNDIAYAATSPGCGGASDGVSALDLASKKVTAWKSSSAIAGSAGPAIAPDGTLFVANTSGELAALDPATLAVKDSHKTEGPAFTSSPVLFQYKRKNLIAAATGDGRMRLLDSAALSSAGYKTPSYSSSAAFVPGALASWQDGDGARWILAPTAGPISSEAGFTATNGGVTNGAVVAWKVVDQNGAAALQPAWVSRDMISPLPPIVLNGVVFAVSSGSPAIVYALDPATGKELWSSGKTIASSAHGGGLSAGGSQVFLGTQDGTLYAFGFPIEH